MRLIKVKTEDGIVHTETVYNVNSFPYERYLYSEETCRKRGVTYYNMSSAFDIETTSIPKTDTSKCFGFMYIWQFCVKDTVCMGRTWKEFTIFLDRLAEGMELSNKKKMVVYVHYLPFEFQFMRNFVHMYKVFAKDKRQVIVADIGNFEFRCSHALSNMPLSKFCANSKLCTYYKLDGDDFNYSVVRTPSTYLSDEELAYCYCDVRGLCQCIDTLLLEDTIATIPLTSTGYIRREVRQALAENPDNWRTFQNIQLSPYLYVLCKTATRGGNTHCNGIYSGQVLEDLKSYDIKSSYPAVMVSEKYPMTTFCQYKKYENFDEYVNTKACLIDVTLYNVNIKSMLVIPYIAKAKCTRIKGGRYDNGRVIHADALSMVITDIDYKIITSHYSYDTKDINSLYCAEYGYLPIEFRRLLMNFFEQKTTLETGDVYLYNKFKNKINAFFGMMLTDICHEEWTYNPENPEAWEVGARNIIAIIERYYKTRTHFLSYQWGIWVTAHARARLQMALDEVKEDVVYIDTDSVKYLGEHDEVFERLNKMIINIDTSLDVPAFVNVRNKNTYLGVFELDAEYDKFISLGAKKYAYIKKGKSEVQITVAGLNKEKGANYINEKGGIELFQPETVIPVEYAGRTVATYNDELSPHTITINGEDIITGSNIGIENTTYTLGISEEYAEFLQDLQNKC